MNVVCYFVSIFEIRVLLIQMIFKTIIMLFTIYHGAFIVELNCVSSFIFSAANLSKFYWSALCKIKTDFNIAFRPHHSRASETLVLHFQPLDFGRMFCLRFNVFLNMLPKKGRNGSGD